MAKHEFRRLRESLGLTQGQVAARLGLVRLSVLRYENGQRRIPGSVALALQQLAHQPASLPLVGIVAAGRPIEPVMQHEDIDIPAAMRGRADTFALRVKGSSMRDEGILSGDVIVVHRQSTAENGQTVVALIDGEATVKKYYRRRERIELHPANEAMTPIVVEPGQDFRIEGIVTGVIRYCGRAALES
jgi:repressor LexA